MKFFKKSSVFKHSEGESWALHFFNVFYYNNYKTDISDYYLITNLTYKLFVDSVFLKKKKFFKNSNKALTLNLNTTNVDKLLNVSQRDGKKIKFLKFLNKLNNVFYYSFIFKSSFFQNKFDTYQLFWNFSKENDFFFNLNFILNNIALLNESIFTVKVIKLNKKSKKKFKKKFDFQVKYLNKNKRNLNVFKSLHLYSNSFNYYNYHERLLACLVLVFFGQKNSKIYKRKISTYSLVLKKKKLN